MEEAIKQVLQSKGWQGIVEILREVENENLASIPTNLSDREIATQYCGKIEAQNIINKLLKKLDTYIEKPEAPKESYK